MKQIDIVKIYSALKRLSDYNLPVKKSYDIFSLSKKLEEPYQFGVMQERKFIKEYGGEVTEDGHIKFSDQENFAKYREHSENLSNMEVDVDFDKITLNLDDFGNQTISPSLLDELSSVIQFE